MQQWGDAQRDGDREVHRGQDQEGQDGEPGGLVGVPPLQSHQCRCRHPQGRHDGGQDRHQDGALLIHHPEEQPDQSPSDKEGTGREDDHYGCGTADVRESERQH